MEMRAIYGIRISLLLIEHYTFKMSFRKVLRAHAIKIISEDFVFLHRHPSLSLQFSCNHLFCIKTILVKSCCFQVETRISLMFYSEEVSTFRGAGRRRKTQFSSSAKSRRNLCEKRKLASRCVASPMR